MTTIKSIKFKIEFASSLSNGFTLVETLAAVTILSLAIIGPIHLIGNSLHKIYYARDQTVAINLAQEGVEMVRQARDSNRLGGGSWTTGISAGSYIIDVGSFVSSASPATECAGCVLPQPVYLDMSANPTKGLYRQNVSGSTFSSTNFSRIVTINSIGTDELRVASKVEWKTGGTTGTITVSEHLFNLGS